MCDFIPNDLMSETKTQIPIKKFAINHLLVLVKGNPKKVRIVEVLWKL